MKTCPDASVLEALAAGRVDVDQSEALWAHLDACVNCRGRYEQAGQWETILRPLREILLEGRLAEPVRAR